MSASRRFCFPSAHASSPDHESSEPSTSPKGSSDSSASDASPKGSASDAVEPKPSTLERGAAAGVWNDEAKTAALAAARNGFSARASGVAAAEALANPANATDGDGSGDGEGVAVGATFASGGDATDGGTGGVIAAPCVWPPNAANAAEGEYPGVETTVAGVDSRGGAVVGAEAYPEAYPDAFVAGVAYGAKPAGGVCVAGVGAGDIGAGIGAERHAEGPGGGGVCAFDTAAAAAARAASARAASGESGGNSAQPRTVGESSDCPGVP